MRIAKIFFSISLLLIVAGGCKIGKNYTKPEVTLPDSFRFAEDTATVNAEIKWWDMFDDPTLDTLIRFALENNNDLLIAAENVEQARLGLKIQKAEMLPKFDMSAQGSRGNFAGFKLDDVSNNFSLTGSVSWEIDIWGKYRRMNEAAKAQWLSTNYGYQFIKISLISSVATTYFSLLEYRKKLEIAQSTYEIRDRTLNIIKQRFDAGIIPEIDYNHAQIQREIAAAFIPYYKRMTAQTENLLSVLIGQLPQSIKDNTTIEDIKSEVKIPAGLPSELLSRRPDILSAEQELIAQNAFIGVAQADRLPSVSLTGLFGAASNDLSNFFTGGSAWSIGAGLASPLFHWRQKSNRLKIERSRYEAAIHEYDQVVLNSLREVEDALVALKTLKDEQAAYQRRTIAAINAMKLSGERYDRGVANYIEYLESQRQAFESQLELVTVKQQILSSYIQLYKALGGGWASEEEMNAADSGGNTQK
ncbi:MAG: TolC family protein [Chlorobi bacterium]|nr:TolC family protein [Chlorobiota bacterium]